MSRTVPIKAPNPLPPVGRVANPSYCGGERVRQGPVRLAGPALSLRAQTASDLADGLAEALLVLHQGQPQIALAPLAEAAAGPPPHLCLLEHFHAKFDRAQPAPPLLRIARPDEHGRFWRFHLPADAPQSLDQDVPA